MGSTPKALPSTGAAMPLDGFDASRKAGTNKKIRNSTGSQKGVGSKEKGGNLEKSGFFPW